MKKYKVAILGAGASGVMCALSTKQKSVALIDSSTKPAKKLLVTGNGRCNLTNTNLNSSFYNTDLEKFFDVFDQNKTLKFFQNIGLETYADEEGRVYPISNSAKSVVDVIENNLKCDLFLGQKIKKIASENGKFVIFTEKEQIEAEKIVVATGGSSAEILNQLKIKHKKFTPSLVALKGADTHDLNGTKLSNVLVSAVCEDGKKKSQMGEVLFKENGLSGIVVFNLSTLFARKSNYCGEIEIDLLPKLTYRQVVEKVKSRKALNVRLDKMFVGMFQNSVANEIFKQAKINTNKPSENLADSEAEKIANSIKSLKFKVDSCYDNFQVLCGGVELCDLTDKLESKQRKGVYVAGEAVDVDGECGGFNLQWAWTSGYIIGKGL